MRKNRLACIAASALALALCTCPAANASEMPDNADAPVFASAPELGSAEDILSRSPADNQQILEKLSKERQAAVLDEAGANAVEPMPSAKDAGSVGGYAVAATAGSNRQLANRLMFRRSLQHFINFRAWHHTEYPGLNWSSDNCSVPYPLENISTLYMDTFQSSCVRHDFGYRNYGKKSALKLNPTEEGRNSIDDRFHRDMKDVAAAAPDAALRDSLYVGASAFYSLVRLNGETHY